MQIVKTEFVLVAEDVAHERFDALPFSLGWDMAERRILVLEASDYRLIVEMRGNTAEAVVFGYVGKKVFAVVLTDRLDCPRDTSLYELSCGVWLSDNLVVGGADAFEAVIGYGSCINFGHGFSLHYGRL